MLIYIQTEINRAYKFIDANMDAMKPNVAESTANFRLRRHDIQFSFYRPIFQSMKSQNRVRKIKYD